MSQPLRPQSAPEAVNRPLDAASVEIRDDFWSVYTDLVRDVVIPYQWEALNDRVEGAVPSRAIRNFRIAAGLEEGTFEGFVFQDSDLYKWLEALAYRLATHPDPDWERIADGMFDLIGAAQEEDGYLQTYFQIKAPDEKWTNLGEAHELYCAGHYIEAAVAYWQATGKRKALDIAVRLADCIGRTFGPGEGQLNGYDGHQEIELALVKLYRATGEERFLRLGSFFIDARGQSPSFLIEEWEKRGHASIWHAGKSQRPDLDYFQAHLPVREQKEAVGHAVRAVYMYAAMADLAALTGDASLLDACRTLWKSIVTKRMYVTGGIGSTRHGEAFTTDYDLPNDSAYAETCASVGLVFFAARMLAIEARAEYADVLERALYNNVIAGIALDGKHYFYVNPLEVRPAACERNPGLHHVKPTRQPWFGCSCCPPNVARLLASLGQYIYMVDDASRTVYAHLYIGSDSEISVDGITFKLIQKTGMPWSGDVTFAIGSLSAPAAFTLALRVPSWCDGKLPALQVNGEPVSADVTPEGYLTINRTWIDGDTVRLELPMPALRLAAHPEVRANTGKIALQRGPFVYCLEEADNEGPLQSISLPLAGRAETEPAGELFPGAVALRIDGYRDPQLVPDGALYESITALRPEPSSVRAVPYALWGNRGMGEMTVWVRYR